MMMMMTTIVILAIIKMTMTNIATSEMVLKYLYLPTEEVITLMKINEHSSQCV